ncbi:hypothetical protein TWF970_004694 [Orbilia oligospora]|uniref:Uncharacterized protein n=1 Tax=Orbilia oligospora TaxID=2813651 RepID=A0A7C8VA89_ORBOL|nr:hypothetical protein TWF970_004694 [Orbilia oligospora]
MHHNHHGYSQQQGNIALGERRCRCTVRWHLGRRKDFDQRLEAYLLAHAHLQLAGIGTGLIGSLLPESDQSVPEFGGDKFSNSLEIPVTRPRCSNYTS